ncbi:uncharacterized protein LOC110270189 isoform X1 [Arachis ipaensis]|uniref:uncharacterized protein LOC110270189 isoform X1 n=1 Tax=Arachis ipaensis TaxID=130454 RepID=UPI000A2B1CCA|nr:uncharacterized protein LOC110270189 isoform X1 [Arachis ipaensis]XP_025644684.1 uncharacterized protein LOC112738432 isoform X1 [Arachis hypogaea]
MSPALKSAASTVEPWNGCCFWRFGREACSDLLLVLVLAAVGASAAIRAAIEAIESVPIPPFLRPVATLFSLFTARTIIGDTVNAIRKLLELLLLLMRVRTKLESRLIL